MQNFLHSFSAKSTIINLTTLDNDLLYYTTASDGIKIFSASQSKIIKNIQSERFNENTKALCISLDAKLIAIANDEKIDIISIENNSLINSIPILTPIKIIKFDFSSTYLFVGTSAGKVCQYRYNSNLRLALLHSFSENRYNFISDFPEYKCHITIAETVIDKSKLPPIDFDFELCCEYVEEINLDWN